MTTADNVKTATTEIATSKAHLRIVRVSIAGPYPRAHMGVMLAHSKRAAAE
jgi:hypothetical protein